MSLEVIASHELWALARGHGAMEAALEQIANAKLTRTVTECRKTARMALSLARSWTDESEALKKKEQNT